MVDEKQGSDDNATEDETDDGRIKCAVCDDKIDEDESTYISSSPSDAEWFADASRSGDICRGCYEAISEYGSTIAVKHKGKKHKFLISDGIVINQFEELGDTPDDVIEGVRSIAKSEHWVSTDAWRGYIDVNGGDTLEEIEDFGVFWGHHSEEMRANEDKAISKALSKVGIPLFTVFTRTSNVFASNASYLVPKKDSKAAKNIMDFIKEWFETEDWRWNLGLVFSDLQNSPMTKSVANDMREKGELKGVNWSAVAYPEQVPQPEN